MGVPPKIGRLTIYGGELTGMADSEDSDETAHHSMQADQSFNWGHEILLIFVYP